MTHLADLNEAAVYAANMEQLADARLVELCEGPGRGARLIEFRNGSGLTFTVAPDRGMDLVDCSFCGIPLVFRTPAGYVSGTRCEPQGNGWLRCWQGGLMTTCGLRNVGVPDGNLGMHGRISSLAAGDVGIRRGIVNGVYRLEATGTLRESMMFGEYLQLERSISTGFGSNSILVDDRITNLGFHEELLELLYHCNFGYPFACPDLEFEMESHDVVPRDADAAARLAEWQRLTAPDPDYREQCFIHHPAFGGDGTVKVSLLNRKLGFRAVLCWNADMLPHFIQWKNCQSGFYALAIEPANASLMGRTADLANGAGRLLAPGETVCTHLEFHFEKL